MYRPLRRAGSADEALATIEALCPSSLADLVASVGSNQAAAALLEWASAEGAAQVAASLRKTLDLSEAGPSEATSLLKSAADNTAAGGALVRRGGGRQEFVVFYHRQQQGRDIIIETISLIISLVFSMRVSCVSYNLSYTFTVVIDPWLLLVFFALLLIDCCCLARPSPRRGGRGRLSCPPFPSC